MAEFEPRQERPHPLGVGEQTGDDDEGAGRVGDGRFEVHAGEQPRTAEERRDPVGEADAELGGGEERGAGEGYGEQERLTCEVGEEPAGGGRDEQRDGEQVGG